MKAHARTALAAVIATMLLCPPLLGGHADGIGIATAQTAPAKAGYYGKQVDLATVKQYAVLPKRSDVTNEVTGTGYTAGGTTVTATVTRDNATDRVDITFANPSWASSTITARGVVIYKSRGGAATADELVCYGDFGANVSSTNGTFTVNFTSPLRFQN